MLRVLPPSKILLVALALLLGHIGASLLAPAAAEAATVNARGGPVVLGQNANEASLQELLDGLTVSGGVDTVSDQSNAALFESAGSKAAATFMLEVAGYADGNELYLYDAADPSRTALVFGGSNTVADLVSVSLLGSDVYVGGALAGADFGPRFGFALHTKAGDWFYSEDALNPNGAAQALIFDGSALDPTMFSVPAPGGSDVYTRLGADSVLVAFEDLQLDRSDHDYQDLVLVMNGVRPAAAVPEPTAAVVFGAGLAVSVWSTRRRA